jgi:hypothetical protein
MAARGEQVEPSFDTRTLLDDPVLTKDNVGNIQGEYDE